MLVEKIFKEMKKDYDEYGEVIQMEYFDDWVGDYRYIFMVEGNKILVSIRNDIEKFEIGFLMEIDSILNNPIETSIKLFNEHYYYSPNVYEEF